MEIIDHGYEIVEFSQAIPNPEDIIKNILELDSNSDVYSVMPPFKDWLEGSHDENGQFVYNLEKGKKKLIYWEKAEIEHPQAARIVKDAVVDPICLPIDRCIELYSSMVGVAYEPASRNLDIRLYAEGLGLGPHGDVNQGLQNEFSFVVYLNDNYEGGELYFNNKDIKIKPKAGTIVAFRSLEVHEALPTKNGIKWHIPYFWYLGMGTVMCNKETPLIDWDKYFNN